VYGRTRSQTGGLLQIWLLKRLASLIALQPILLGLIVLSRRLWPEGGALIGVGLVTIIFIEVYARLKERQAGRAALSPVSQHALESFRKAAQPDHPTVLDEESTSVVSSGRAARTRGSFASVLEMMSTTLAVVPTQYQQHGPVPIRTSCHPHLSGGPPRVFTSVSFVAFSDRNARRPHSDRARCANASGCTAAPASSAIRRPCGGNVEDIVRAGTHCPAAYRLAAE